MGDTDGAFRIVFDGAPIGMLILDEDDRVADANEAVARMLGCEVRELIGRRLSEYAGAGGSDPDPPLVADLIEHGFGAVTLERRYRRPDGTPWWGRMTLWRLDSQPSSSPPRAIGMIQDVTGAREAERALHEQEHLARLGRMASVVAHEFKNPLAGISGALQVIENRMPGGTREREILRAIQARLRGLDQIVQDLQMFARPLRLPSRASVSLRHVLGDCVELLESDARHAAVEVQVIGDDSRVAGDPELLRALFLRLLINAAQAMSGEGTVRVQLVREAEVCRVDVEDSGPGLPPDAGDQIFEPFYTTRSHGTGLGLAIARRIAEAHGGEISAHSPEGGGTRISARLPLAGEDLTPAGNIPR